MRTSDFVSVYLWLFGTKIYERRVYITFHSLLQCYDIKENILFNQDRKFSLLFCTLNLNLFIYYLWII